MWTCSSSKWNECDSNFISLWEKWHQKSHFSLLLAYIPNVFFITRLQNCSAFWVMNECCKHVLYSLFFILSVSISRKRWILLPVNMLMATCTHILYRGDVTTQLEYPSSPNVRFGNVHTCSCNSILFLYLSLSHSELYPNRHKFT